MKRSATSALCVALIAACATRPTTKDEAKPVSLSLRLRGVDVATRSVAELRSLGAGRITVLDPHEHRPVELEAAPLVPLLDATLGPGWRGAEEVVATCLDGFHPAIPVALLLEREAYVAFARPESRDFAVQEEPTKRTPVGPYYIVWKRSAGDDPPEPDWPFQVTALEVTDFATRFAAVVPPAGADALAREGFERFRTFCLPCHTVNGAGGAVGPELNYPVSVTEYFAEPILRQWIDDPSRVRWNAKMPPPLPPGPDRPRTIEEIVTYLKVMAHAKRAPSTP